MGERSQRAQLGAEALKIVTGGDAVLTAQTNRACEKTKLYTETDCAKLDRQRAKAAKKKEMEWFDSTHQTDDDQARCAYVCMCDRPESDTGDFEVTQETSLEAARRLAVDGKRIGVLNFASGRHPGGGFLSGSKAQEESLARSSGLYPCLAQIKCKPFYEGEALWYSHSVIVSPDVPVFRDDSGAMLAKPYNITFITCAAPNISAMNDHQMSRNNLNEVLQKRISCFLSVAAASNIDTLVLGAWGCGAFGNDPTEMAHAFSTCFSCGGYENTFKKIVFAIPDDPESALAWPFYSKFA